MLLICQMTLQDQVMKESCSCDFMGGSWLSYAITLASQVTIGI